MAGMGDNLGEILVDQGWATKKEVSKALKRIKMGENKRLGEILIDASVIDDDKLANALAIQSGNEYVGNQTLTGSPEAVDLVTMEFAKTRKVLPISVDDSKLTVAIVDPMDLSLLDDLSFMTNMQIECKIGSLTAIESGINRSYEGGEGDIEDLLDKGDEFEGEGEDEEDIDEDDAPVIKLVNAIIANAVKMEASDIHIESLEKSIRVRYRIDGKCVVVENPPKRLQGALYGRIKLMAKMDIAEKRKPQDGPIKMKIFDRGIDLRVSTLPSSFGESIVMRILDKESVMKGVEQLGFHPSDYDRFSTLIDRPNGIVLVTGPTGSGKTTTLYAALNAKNKSNVKIITAEDPVEYNVSGINQAEVNHQIGLNFARILRAMLRQAPNVILVGEIRDMETAEIAIEASLTGHLVFSTLHTNDAPSSVTRLIDLGVKPYLVSASVIAILAQRLIRLNCKICKEEYEPEQKYLDAAGVSAEMLQDRVVYRGKGCDACNGTGYKGRIGIYELMVMNASLRDAIFRNEPTHVIRDVALKGGMSTLLMDGVRKFYSGITTIEEVLRVAKSTD